MFNVADADMSLFFFQSWWKEVLCFLTDSIHRWKRDFRRVSILYYGHHTCPL